MARNSAVRATAAIMLAGLCVFALGCAQVPELNRKGVMERASRLSRLEFGAGKVIISEELMESPPISVAILPFKSGTKNLGRVTGLRFRKEEERLAYEREFLSRLREQFYGHFSRREFRDRELRVINSVLQRAGIVPEQLDEIEPQRLGSLLEADALVYGEVTSFRIVYMGLVARVTVGLSVRMVSSETGSVLWTVREVRSKNRLTASINPFAVVFGVYSNAVDVSRGHVARVVDFLCEKIVSTIPTVHVAALGEPFIESAMVDMLQPAEGERKGLHVLVRGSPGFEGVCVLPGGRAEHPLDEVGIGEYCGFVPTERGSGDVQLVFRLRDPSGEREVTRSVTVHLSP